MASTNLATSKSHGGINLVNFATDLRQPEAPYSDHLRLQRQLDSLLKSIKSSSVREVVCSIFVDLTRLRSILHIVEVNSSEGGPLPVALALLSLVESEAKSLIRFIEKRIPEIKSIKGPLRQVLDGTSFALRHEVKRVFGHELADINSGRKANQVRTDVMRAHGLLSNCFQQSIIALTQVFDSSINAERLFDDYRDRFEQSTVLLKELSTLLALAREAGEKQNNDASDLLMRELGAFSHGTMHYLMYRDWDEFADIAREVTNSYGSARHGFILHCFATYLDALINQVQMRAVFNDESHAAPQEKQIKVARKAGAKRTQKRQATKPAPLA